MARFIAAIDQGTTSTRCILFDRSGAIAALAQSEHRQHTPRPGWVEHDPLEIWETTQAVVRQALAQADVTPGELAAVGITNQRETTVVWDRRTGLPLHRAIVWQDTRTSGLCAELSREGGQDRFRPQTGLPLATYFSGPKIRWLLDNVPEVGAAAREGHALAGTIDSWLIWNLTGGPRGGVHLTDVSNASRTMLMNLGTLTWEGGLLEAMRIPPGMLPAIRSSSDVYGVGRGVLEGVPVAGDLGDQQAALVGQTCFSPGEAKNTYGTGCFLLLNTGTAPITSRMGLLTTVGYRLGDGPAVYCLEGSIAVAGSLVQWLRDNLRMIDRADQIEELAASVADNGGVYIVPAFSGLFAPYWRSDARGVIVGLTRFADRGHLARAVLESTAYQVSDVVDAMRDDSGVALTSLRVDGGMVANALLMQFQSDILQVPVIRPVVAETTALGAAYAAGLAVGFWDSLEDLKANWRAAREWRPGMPEEERARLLGWWKKAVTRSFDWTSEPG